MKSWILIHTNAMNLKLLPELHEKPFVCVIFAIVIIYMARRARDSFPMLQAEKVYCITEHFD